MTVLISGGDSFTYGSELPSQEHTWANILANRKGWNICNTAKPAASNSAIRRQVMNAVNKYTDLDLYVVVMWSFPNRYEFRFTYDTEQVDSPWYSINPWTYNDQNFEDHFHNKDDAVLKAAPINNLDSDEDGIQDSWETYYFGSLENVSLETDYNNNSINDGLEFWQETYGSAGVLLPSIISPSLEMLNSQLNLSWPGESGVLYKIYTTSIQDIYKLCTR